MYSQLEYKNVVFLLSGLNMAKLWISFPSWFDYIKILHVTSSGTIIWMKTCCFYVVVKVTRRNIPSVFILVVKKGKWAVILTQYNLTWLTHAHTFVAQEESVADLKVKIMWAYVLLDYSGGHLCKFVLLMYNWNLNFTW